MTAMMCSSVRKAMLSLTMAAVIGGAVQTASAAGVAGTGKPAFVLSIPGAADGDTFPRKRAPADPQCGGGDDLSPPLSWHGAPAGTRSFAIVMSDPDGRQGLGVVHWIRYGLPGDLDHLDEGAGKGLSLAGRGGMNTPGNTFYHGPCPPAGEVAHHYVIQVFALDLAPDALPGGLTRDALFAALQGHILANTSIVQRYGL